jgi:hypothetical protein
MPRRAPGKSFPKNAATPASVETTVAEIARLLRC